MPDLKQGDRIELTFLRPCLDYPGGAIEQGQVVQIDPCSIVVTIAGYLIGFDVPSNEFRVEKRESNGLHPPTESEEPIIELKKIVDFRRTPSPLQLSGARLTGAQLFFMNLDRASFRGANLREARLTSTYLYEADLCEADLRQARMEASKLLGASLQNADLCQATLADADLRDANLRGAILIGADLRGANLSGADLRDADLREAKLAGPSPIMETAQALGLTALDSHPIGPILQGAKYNEQTRWPENMDRAFLQSAILMN